MRDGGVAPAACAHLLGQVIEAQWQIETFRRFEIPEVLVETHGTGPG